MVVKETERKGEDMESNLQIWRRNLYICCVASFVVAVGMSQMAPILPQALSRCLQEFLPSQMRSSRVCNHTIFLTFPCQL